MSIVKDALDRARKESGFRDRKSLLLFIIKSFLDGTNTAGIETRKLPYKILLHHIEPESAGGATEEKISAPHALSGTTWFMKASSVWKGKHLRLIWRDERGQVL